MPEPQAVRALYGEACGEPYRVKVLVAATIRARGSLRGIYGAGNKQLAHVDARAWAACVKAWREAASVKVSYRYFGGFLDDRYFAKMGKKPALTLGHTRFYE